MVIIEYFSLSFTAEALIRLNRPLLKGVGHCSFLTPTIVAGDVPFHLKFDRLHSIAKLPSLIHFTGISTIATVGPSGLVV